MTDEIQFVRGKPGDFAVGCESLQPWQLPWGCRSKPQLVSTPEMCEHLHKTTLNGGVGGIMKAHSHSNLVSSMINEESSVKRKRKSFFI